MYHNVQLNPGREGGRERIAFSSFQGLLFIEGEKASERVTLLKIIVKLMQEGILNTVELERARNITAVFMIFLRQHLLELSDPKCMTNNLLDQVS